ncbi:MAG: hypothetical protein DMG37_13075 [Acidobacteria bacterium]|nr:MAG: hypothetical protein DMG37_13075 [Acidobacteriota bacterium]
MDLVDRYLKAVAKALPEAQREDIIRELTEDIQSEMEDKQSELGRELTEAEQESLLKQRGNPLLRHRNDFSSVERERKTGPLRRHSFLLPAATVHSVGGSDADFLVD